MGVWATQWDAERVQGLPRDWDENRVKVIAEVGRDAKKRLVGNIPSLTMCPRMVQNTSLSCLSTETGSNPFPHLHRITLSPWLAFYPNRLVLRWIHRRLVMPSITAAQCQTALTAEPICDDAGKPIKKPRPLVHPQNPRQPAFLQMIRGPMGILFR